MVFDEAFGAWKSAFLSPARFFSSKRAKADFASGVKWVAAAATLVAVATWMSTPQFWQWRQQTPQDFYALLLLILLPVLGFIVASAFVFSVAALMGGKGDFRRQTYFMGALSAPLYLSFWAVVWAGSKLAFDYMWLMAVEIVLIVGYSYLTYEVARAEHRLGRLKSTIVAAVPIILILMVWWPMLLLGSAAD